MMSKRKEALLSSYARTIALPLDLKPCQTSQLLLVNNNNNNNKDIEQQHQHLTSFRTRRSANSMFSFTKIKRQIDPGRSYSNTTTTGIHGGKCFIKICRCLLILSKRYLHKQIHFTSHSSLSLSLF